MDTSRKRNSSELEEPIVIRRNVPEIFQIFHNAQFNSVHHRKYIKELKKVYRKIDEDVFRESFVNALHYTFTFGDANGNVDRVLQFVANFCTSIDDEEDFLHFIFDVIFDCVSVTGQSVRSRSCQLLGLLLTSLGDEATLDGDICNKILESQIDRLQDVRGAVRCRAVLTLQRLQNPSDEDDNVTKSYNFHMSCDPSAAVRRAVISSLAKSARNLLYVMERLCDVDESVRKVAFIYVSSINVTQLKVSQRVHILKVGLSERSSRVRKVVETALVPAWLGAYCGDVLALLGSIRLDNLQGAKDSAFVVANLLQCLFKSRQVTELLDWLPTDPRLKLIPSERLCKESAWYWRHLVRHLHSTENVDSLEQALPELVIFTDYVRAVIDSPCPSPDTKEYSTRQHILQELMNIFPVYDMADVVGRKALQTLLYDALIGSYRHLEEEVIRATMRAVDLAIPEIQNRIEFVASVISEMHEPVEEIPVPQEVAVESSEIKMMRAGLRVSLNEALEEQEEAVRAQDFSLAATCKAKVDSINKKLEELNLNLKEKQAAKPSVEIVKEKRDDPETLNKCLLVLNMMLDSPQITKLTPVLMSLFENFEVMIFTNAEIRQNALKTVALYSMLDEGFSKDHTAFFFSQLVDIDNEPLTVTSLKCVIDIMCVQGIKVFNVNAKENDIDKSRKSMNKSKTKNYQSDNLEEDFEAATCTQITHDTIIEMFLKFVDGECTEYREIAVEGFCKLLMAGRLSSAYLVSRLLILWFNPACEEEDTMRQLLGTFFPAFASHVEDAQEQLEAAFLPTLSTLANAPHASPLSTVDQEMVLKFMIGLTLPTVAPTARNVHSNLCVSIVNALERGAGMTEPILCRALALLTPPKTMDLCQDLLRSATDIIKTVSDKNCNRNIARFQALLAMTIEALEERQSTNPGLETLPEEPTLLSNFDSVKNSVAPELSVQNQSLASNRTSKDSERDSDNFNIESAVSSSPTSNCSSKDATSISPSSSPPRKIKAISASDVAKRAIRKSSRTPRVVKQPAVTPGRGARRNTNSVQKTAPKKSDKHPTKGKSARKLESQLNDVSDDETKGNTKKKTINKKQTIAKNTKKVQIKESSESSSTSSSDDETILHTICHEKSEIMRMDSSSEEEIVTKSKKVLTNVTIPASDSDSGSDDSSSSSSDDEHVSLIEKQLGRRVQRKK